MCGIALIVSDIRMDLSSLLPDFTTSISAPEIFQQHYFNVDDTKAALRRKGPDSLGTKKVFLYPNICCAAETQSVVSFIEGEEPIKKDSNCDFTSSTCGKVEFIGATLQLRGTTPVTQPLADSSGNILIYNGEIFGGVHVSSDSNDAEIIMQYLGKCCPCTSHEHTKQCSCSGEGLNSVPELLSTIKGPWALIYWQESSKTIWFGKDAFGRRSLLVHWPSSRDSRLLLSSVSPISSISSSSELGDKSEINELIFWEELPCGVHSLSMYGSNEEEYLVGEVRNHDWTNPMLEELIKWERSFVEPMPEQLNSTHTSILSRQEDMQLACLVPGDSGPTQASIPSPSLAVAVLTALRKSVMRRAVLNKIYQAVSCDNAEERNAPAPVAVLFSGGLDSMILAALLDECLDTKYEIDLLNVSFDGQFAPDRISARAGVKELQRIAPLRSWKLVEIDADLVKLTSETKHVMSLINPAKTYMDLNIGIALWLAAGGNGRVNEVIGNNTDADNQHVKYKSEARILLVGSGADEQCTGYGRHKTKYRQGSWSRLHEEMKLDMQRIWKRNLGRDDRCVADNGKEARFPFLDEDVIRTLLDIPLWEIADLDQPSGVGDKKILREVARLLGLYEAALLPKRAIQGPRQKPSRCSHDHVSITQLDDRKIETAPRSSSSSVKKEIIDDEILRQQAVAAVLLLKQHQQQLQNGSFPQFDRSTSVQYPLTSSKKQNKLPRSSSSRPSSLLDPPAHHLNNQDLKVDDDLETKHFVLVHGGGFGAWCWYKSMTFLKEAGFEADAIDLTGSGIDATDSNSITSFAQYVKPLVDFLENLGDGKKVILVGHDFGGFCVSYVMELFPSKVSKAIFVAAAMLTSGQSTLTAFQGQSSSSDLMRQAQKFIYANGKDNPPTAISLDKSLLSDLLYNLSPTKDAVLASVSMRPMPFAPIMEKLSLSEANYGSIPRFYIKTEEDFAIPVSLQEFMIKSNPPEQVFQLNGSDHSPFFSRPQALHKLLLELSKIPPKQVSSPNSLDGALTEKA